MCQMCQCYGCKPNEGGVIRETEFQRACVRQDQPIKCTPCMYSKRMCVVVFLEICCNKLLLKLDMTLLFR